MPKFKINMVDTYSGDVLETLDETFDNERDAEEYASDCSGAYAQGAETLSLMGRDYDDPSNIRFDVEEIDT